MKQHEIRPEVAMNKIQEIFKKQGTRALEMARKAVLVEKLQSQKAQQALTYFMTEYWHDTARPSLMALTCKAVGGNPELTQPVAVPMILISGAIDIHDDIIDQSRRKDGRPTVYGKFGKEIALLIGDALLFKGLTLLNNAIVKDLPTEKMREIVCLVKSMFFELGDAEALELEYRGRLDLTSKAYLELVRLKAADVEAHTHISAILGNASEKETKALSEYGRMLGMMIIIKDDIIDLMIPEECRSRIRKECLPLPLLYGLEDMQLGARLKTMLQRKAIGNREHQEILNTIYGSKAMKKYDDLMKKIGTKAIDKLRYLKYQKGELELLVKALLPSMEEDARTER
jgi:heptaprenyl diphosphate synthase